jgi:Family of unknown function (DUF6603)
MANEPGFLQSVIGKIGEFFLWLKEKMQDDQVRRDTLLNLGLDPDKEVSLQIPDGSLNNIDQYRKSVNPDDAAFKSAVNDIKTIYSATKEFIKAIIDNPTENPQDIHTLLWRFFEVMGTNYARLHYPGFYWFAQLSGFLVESGVTGQSAVKGQGTPDITYNIVTKGPVFLIENLWELITHPIAYVTSFPEKIGKVYGSISNLDTLEDAENWSELMIVLAGFFTYAEKNLPDPRYLYGWDIPPKKWSDEHMDELKNSFQGDHLLYKIRKEHKDDFPIDDDKLKAWEKIKSVITKTSPTDTEKKIIELFKIAVEQWKRGSWSDLVSERAFSFDLKLPQDEESSLEKRLGGTLFFVSDEEVSGYFNKDPQVKQESLGGLFISLNGEVSYTYQINDNWEFKIKTTSGDALDMYLSRLPDANVLGDLRLDLSLKRKADPKTGASYNLPDENGTRLAVGEIQITAFLTKEDGGIEIGLKDNAVVVSGGEGDGFINEILPSGDVPLKFTVSAGYTRKKGFYIDHDIGLLKDILGSEKKDETKPKAIAAVTAESTTATDKTSENKNKNKEKQPFQLLIPIHKDLDLLYFDNVKWDYGPITKDGELGGYLKVLTTFSSKLGPVIAKVENTGLGIEVSTPKQEGDLGTTDFSFGFSPPKGVALSIDSEIIKGGGFLELDFENNRYAGVLDFKLDLKKRSIGLVAVGLINTRLPNGEKGFSMLINISVIFSPAFPLAFGFKLAAVGGLVGIHRTMKVDILRERIQNGAINSIMFPENVIQNASKIISDLREVFPPQKNHYVVAPFFKIAYGTPTLLEVDIGILFEFPFKGRLILLGSLAVYLPDKDAKKRLGEIHVDIFGDFNFAKSYILIEGRLRASKLVEITLTGGFAFMLDWGSNPQFLLSIGGFHPRYKKPAKFPEVPRITALIKKGDDIRLSCESYQAITSNSFQFGLNAELVINKGHARVYGFLGFNALFQFDPFHFETDIRISVEVSYRGRSFFGIDLEFEFSGPEPWHAQGYAKIKVLFFSLKIKFNVSWGDEQKAVPEVIKTDDLLERLQVQLQQSGNWSAKLPDEFSSAESLRSLEESEKQDQIFVHPSGSLELRQNQIPLNMTLEKIGNSNLEAKTSYQISELVFGTGEPADAKKQKPLQDYFSRGQFEKLTDDEKLSTPDFDLMTAGIEISPEQAYDIPSESDSIQSAANDFEDIILGEEGNIKQENSENWQGERVMNIRGNRKNIDVTKPEELFGVVDEVPEQNEKAYKILSKEALNSPEQLKQQYFNTYSSAKDYLQTHWPKVQQKEWQILQTVVEENEKVLIV